MVGMICGKDRFQLMMMMLMGVKEREGFMDDKRGDATEEVEITEAERKREESEVG